MADPQYTRAWPGGVGDRKMGSNYAPTIHVQKEAANKGLQQVLWLYGEDHQLTEVGTMNIFVLYVNENGGLYFIFLHFFETTRTKTYHKCFFAFIEKFRERISYTSIEWAHFTWHCTRFSAAFVKTMGRLQSNRKDHHNGSNMQIDKRRKSK